LPKLALESAPVLPAAKERSKERSEEPKNDSPEPALPEREVERNAAIKSWSDRLEKLEANPPSRTRERIADKGYER